MSAPVEAFPLHWPPHRKRTAGHQRKRAPFHQVVTKTYSWDASRTYSAKESLSVTQSRDRVIKQLEMLGGRGVIISSNLKLRQDGLPLGHQSNPDDPGVAVYFQLNKQPHCLSCDSWDRAADNLAAIAKHVEAMRGQLRWGVADVASMFAGFKALPGAIVTPAMSEEEAVRTLYELAGENPEAEKTDRDLYRAAARRWHPDVHQGQQLPQWDRLQAARSVLQTEV